VKSTRTLPNCQLRMLCRDRTPLTKDGSAATFQRE
jgi:hypothetical protein